MDAIAPPVRKQASRPHELFMVNMLLFHLLALPAAIALDIGLYGALIPLGLSSLVMLATLLRSRATGLDPFVSAHWRFALSRYRLLLIAYAVSAALMGVGALVASGSADPNKGQIVLLVFARIAVMPTLVMVFVLAALESSAIKMAGSGEWPPLHPQPGQE